MNVKQFPSFSNSIAASMKVLTVGSLAIGLGAAIGAAPAGAVALNNSNLTFGRGVDTFFADVNPVSGDTITVTFGGDTNVSSANGPLANAPFFDNALPSPYNFTNSPVATFNYVAGNSGGFLYSLASNLTFNFANGVDLTIASGTVFNGSKNSGSTAFSTIDATGSFFKNGTDVTALNALSFGFNDISGTGDGTYGLTASTILPQSNTQVPEPFTIVGTLVGGTAALRMRKKLSKSAK